MNAAAHTVLLPIFLLAVAVWETVQTGYTLSDFRFAEPEESAAVVRRFFVHLVLAVSAWGFLCAP